MKRHSELSQLGQFLTGKFPTCIAEITWDCPAKGKFILQGSIPVVCCDPETHRSKLFNSLADAKSAVESAGVQRYQLPDCSWNRPA